VSVETKRNKVTLVQSSVSQTLLLAGPFWLRKVTSSHIIAHVKCRGDRYPKLKFFICEVFSVRY
jgi:hypothetical protein